ncbi:MAG: hypothetical protein LBD11_00790 [Candidatus Peribacteria bacterium]|nr:hypothetical protein [Candidatus Peribacteria bacterium]
MIIANKTSSGIVDTKYIVENDARLSLTDTNAIAIELLLNGVLLDTFVVDSITVVAYKNKVPRLSFERLYEDGVWNIEASIPDHNFNIEVFTANPGKVTILGTETPWI